MISERRVVIVRRQTRLDELILRYNTVAQAQFYIEHMGGDFSDIALEHKQYNAILGTALASLSAMTRLHVLDRSHLSNFIFAKDDLVVVIGQDGLVANTMKYLQGQPIVGINPDPSRWDGVLLPFQVHDLPQIMPDALMAKRKIKLVSMARVNLNDGQTLLAVNDIFVGQKGHASARYRLIFNQQTERQSSSGIIISTGLGSTGWMKSIVTGAAQIAQRKAPDESLAKAWTRSWDTNELLFSVREPYPSRSTGTSLLAGAIRKGESLRVLSEMGENGTIFSDGMEKDFLEFNSGMEATISLADLQGQIIV